MSFETSGGLVGSTMLNLPGNRDVYARYLDFRNLLDQVKIQHPLANPFQYYPYGTMDNIPQMLPVLDSHGIDIKECVQGKTILDLGAGDGELSFFLELFNPKQIIAIDAAPFNYNHLEGFRALRSALQSSVELIDGDVHLVDFARLPTFDVAFCLGFLYHSPHPMWILEKLARSTRILFLNTKVFDAEKSYAYFYDAGECNNDESNWWCYSAKTVRLMLKRAGLTAELMERVDSNLGNSDPVDMNRDGRILVYAVNGEGAKELPQVSASPGLYDSRRGEEQLASADQIETQAHELTKQRAGPLAQDAIITNLQLQMANQKGQLDRMRRDLDNVTRNLSWSQDQLRQMQATRTWRIATIYWRTHAKVKALFRG